MPFIGNQPALSYTSFAKQDFTTSATTSYTLSQPVANENEIALFINFVRQEPTTAYTASGTSLTLTSATSASDDMYAIFLGKAVQTVNPPAGSVGTSQLANGAVTSAKLDSGLALGKVLQVVNATYSTNVTSSSNTFADSGLTASITPSSASNKVLVFANINGIYKNANNTGISLRLLRGGTNIHNIESIASFTNDTSASAVGSASTSYLDSPSTTSSTIYKIQFNSFNNLGTVNINANSVSGGTVSTMTLMEIAG